MAAIVRLLLMIPIVFASAGTIDGSHRYAWGENIGWIDFGSAEGNVVVNDDYLTGYAWGENIGWISLNCSNTGSCNTVNYYVNNTTNGQLSGYAWSENAGWINFSPGFGVNPVINTTSGEFTGYAWGENTGWINFNCSNTNDCSNVNYYLAAIWTPTSSGGGSGGGAPGSSSATPVPAASQTPVTSSVPGVSATPAASSAPVTSIAPKTTATPLSTTTPYASPPSTPPSYIKPTSPPGSEDTSTFGDFVKSIPGKIAGTYEEAIKPVIKVIPSIVKNFSKPVSIATSLGVAVSTAASAVSVAASGVNFLAYIEFFLKNLLVFFGLKKKARAWGTIYNSITKQPLAYTKVQLLGKDFRVLETRMTDREGRYGFLINANNAEQYDIVDLQIKPIREGFEFPSKNITGQSDLMLYPKVYNGGIVQVRVKELVKFDIPMDPINQQGASLKIRIPSAFLHNLWINFSHLMFWIALVAVPINYVINPTFVNLIMLIVFLGLNLLIFVGDLEQRPYGVVVDHEAGNPISYSLIILSDQENGDRRGFTVSDERGRYFLLSKKGNFKISAYTPAQVIPPRSTEKDISVDRGWIAKKLDL